MHRLTCRVAKVEGFPMFEYQAIASRIGAQGGHRPQVPAPPLRRGQLEDAVGEGGQEFVLPGAALLGGPFCLGEPFLVAVRGR